MHWGLVAFRIGQTLILLTGLGCLGYGGWRLYDEIRFLTTSVRVTGEVVGLRETTEERTPYASSDGYTGADRYVSTTVGHPIVRFRSPIDGRLHRVTSDIGYDDDRYKIGATIPTRASTREAGVARHSDLVRRFLIPGILLLIGIFGTVGPVAMWHMPDSEFGIDDRAGMSLFRSLSLVKVLVPLGVLGALVAAAHAWAPWAPNVVLGDGFCRVAEMQAAPPGPGRLLSATEARIASLPYLGHRTATAALVAAIENGRRGDVERYLKAYRDPSLRFPIEVEPVRYFGAAARAGDAHAVRMLVDAGIDARRDPWAIEDAVGTGRGAILRTLAGLGATPADAGARRALVDTALRRHDDETLLALVELGWVDTDQTFDGRVWGAGDRGTILDVALVRGLARSSGELERRGVASASPLLARLVAGDVDGMRALLPEREWSRARIFDAPLLSYAAIAGNALLVRRLVGLGADPGALATVDPRAPDVSALDEAVRRGHLDVVRHLATLPGAKAYLDPRGRTSPVCEASRLGRWDVVRVLVEAGADPNARYDDLHMPGTWRNVTPLHRAALDGAVEAVRHLLAHGADPRAEAEDKLLPVELARDDAARAALEEAGGRGP